MRGFVVAITLALLVLSSAPVRADCDHFKWPLAREKTWFAASPEPIEAGSEIIVADRAFTLTLKPNDAAGYLLPLTKPAVAGAYGGVVRVAAITKAALYEVTLSREAWVDIIQNNARVKTRNVSRQRDCAVMHKSVQFQLTAGAAALQISGVDAPTIALALAPAEPTSPR
jgi:hypothetical protein